MKDFGYYAGCFGGLHTAVKLGRPAPHKALLLLAVIDLVEKGVIRDNRIAPSEVLAKAFNDNAKKFYATSAVFKPEVTKPFFHLQYEPFWQLVAAGGEDFSLAAESEAGYGKRRPARSLKGLQRQYSCALIDPELFDLLKDEDARARFRVLLISTYLNNRPD